MRPDSRPTSYNLNFFDRSIEGFANMEHELIQLAENIDWPAIEAIVAIMVARQFLVGF